MKKRTKIILSIAIAAVLLTFVSLVFIVPRVMLHQMAKELLPACVPAEYFTDYSLKYDNTFTVSNEYFSVEIPEGYVYKEDIPESLNVSAYVLPETASTSHSYMIINEPYNIYMNLLDPEYSGETEMIPGIKISNQEKIFTSLDYPAPDSFYNIMKGAALLDKKDYTFWNYKKQVAFVSLAYIKEAFYADCNTLYIYERDDIRAIIRCPQESNLHTIDIVHIDDLNTAYSITVKTDNINDVFALINSFEFIK